MKKKSESLKSSQIAEASTTVTDVDEFVKSFARTIGKKTWRTASLNGNQVADILGYQTNWQSQKMNKFNFTVYEIATGKELRADAIFSGVGQPDTVLPASKKEPNQEWIFKRGTLTVRCLMMNIFATAS